MVQGLTLRTPISPKDTRIPIFLTASRTKNSASTLIVNFPMEYLGLAASILVDNQDAAGTVTVRLNGNLNTVTIPASSFRAFDDAWIEQIELSGASTNTQLTAQIVPRDVIGV